MNENWVTFIKPEEQVRDFRAYAVRVLEVLREVEWRDPMFERRNCRVCRRTLGDGHAPDCALAVLIRETEEMLT